MDTFNESGNLVHHDVEEQRASGGSRTTSFIASHIDYLMDEMTSSSNSNTGNSVRYSSSGGSSRSNNLYLEEQAVGTTMTNASARFAGHQGNLIQTTSSHTITGAMMDDVNLDGSAYRDHTRTGGLDGSSRHSISSWGYGGDKSNSNNKSQRRFLAFAFIFLVLIGVAGGIAAMKNHNISGDKKAAAASKPKPTPSPTTAPTPAPTPAAKKEDEEEELVAGAAIVDSKDEKLDDLIEEDEKIDNDLISEIEEDLKEDIEFAQQQKQDVLDHQADPQMTNAQKDILDKELQTIEQLEDALSDEEDVWEKVDGANTVEDVNLLAREAEVIDTEEDNLSSQAELLDKEVDATPAERDDLQDKINALQEEEKTLENQQMDIRMQEEALVQRGGGAGFNGGR